MLRGPSRTRASIRLVRIAVIYSSLRLRSLRLSRQISVNTKSSKVRRGVYAKLTPGTFSEAGRIIMDWCKAFDGYLDKMRSLEDPSGDLWGTKRQFGVATRLQSDKYLAQPIRLEIARSINARVVRRGRKHRVSMIVEQYSRLLPISASTIPLSGGGSREASSRL